MKRDRITFYKHDGPYFGYQLVDFPSMPVPDYEAVTINDAIEFYMIKQYFEHDLQVPAWTKEEFEIYREKSEKLYGLTMRFFNNLRDERIVDEYITIELSYHSCFWELFEKCKLYEKISEDVFRKIIHTEIVAPDDLFRHQKIVHAYGNALKEYILENFSCVRTIIHVYEQDSNPKMEKLYLPSELTNDERCAYIKDYIESDQANPNVLREIQHINKQSNVISLPDELRLKAKRRFEEIVKQHFHTGIAVSFEIAIVKNTPEVKANTQEGYHFKTTYSEDWLLDSLDYPSIMNNFIYVFDYVDSMQFRFNCVSKQSDIGVFEKLFLPSSRRYYPESGRFRDVNNISLLQMNAYYSFLEYHGIRLEDVIRWVFMEYLQEEFHCPEMRIVLPSPQTTFAEKCGTVCLAIESILKQFNEYAKSGEIDFELLAMSSGSPKFKEIPSLIDEKNVYGIGKDYEKICKLCFSNQHTLHVDRIDKEHRYYDSFLELIRKECIFLSDYQADSLEDIHYLESHDMVTIQEDDRIVEKITWKRVLLQDLYVNQGIVRYHYPEEAQASIQELIDTRICELDAKLLSKSEVSFLNYMLNNVEHCNGYELRNGYAHGILQVFFDEKENRRNYMNLLRILVLLSIKINDEFCLREELQEAEEEQ